MAEETESADAEKVVEQGEGETDPEVSSSDEKVVLTEDDEKTEAAARDAEGESDDAEHFADAEVKEGSETRADKPERNDTVPSMVAVDSEPSSTNEGASGLRKKSERQATTKEIKA